VDADDAADLVIDVTITGVKGNIRSERMGYGEPDHESFQSERSGARLNAILRRDAGRRPYYKQVPEGPFKVSQQALSTSSVERLV